MKKIVLLLLSVIILGQARAQTWTIDNSHSQVLFTVSHLVISEVTGNFKSFSGKVTSSKPDFIDADVEFVIDINSINTESESRDNHLKSDEFFNAAKYPTMKFKGKGLKKISGNKYELAGNLTIRDITRPVTLNVVYSGTVQDPWGNTKAGFKITGIINRFDYDLKWNTVTEAGGSVVGEDVQFTSNLELTKAK